VLVFRVLERGLFQETKKQQVFKPAVSLKVGEKRASYLGGSGLLLGFFVEFLGAEAFGEVL
jgi:hypothetical protein